MHSIDLSMNIISVRPKTSLTGGKTTHDRINYTIDDIQSPKLRFTGIVLGYNMCHTSRKNYIPDNISYGAI